MVKRTFLFLCISLFFFSSECFDKVILKSRDEEPSQLEKDLDLKKQAQQEIDKDGIILRIF